MSQHNIIGSEAFDRTPFVIIRQVRAGGMRRRRTRTALAFVAGAVATAGDGSPWQPGKTGAVVGTARAHAAVMRAVETAREGEGEGEEGK